jgi:hypothetical protein
MQEAIHTRFFRLIYGSPKRSDIFSRIKIGIHIVSAVCTRERLVFSCANTVANTTSLGGVCRFNNNKLNAVQSCLVIDKGAKLPERPATKFYPKLFVSTFRGEPDVSQVFNGNSFALHFCRLNNAFRNSMIDDCCGSPFLAFEPFQELCAVSFARMRSSFRAFALNGATNLLPMFTVSVKRIGGMLDAVRGNNYIGEPKIHTDEFLYILNVFFGNFYGLEKIEFTLFVNQISLAFNVWQVLWIVANKRNVQSSADSPDRYGEIFVSEYPAVIGNCAKLTKGTFFFLIQLISICHFADAAHKHLRGEVERGFKSVITEVVYFELIENFVLPRNIGNGIANSISLPHRLNENASLFRCGQKFYFQRQFHTAKILIIFLLFKYLKENLSTKTCKEQDITTT